MTSIRVAHDSMPFVEFEETSASLIEQLHEGRAPIVVTQDDKAAFVAMSPEDYDGLQKKLSALQEQVSFMAAVNEGLEDVRAGRVVDDADLDAFLQRELLSNS